MADLILKFLCALFLLQDVHSDENNTKNANHHQTLVCLPSSKSFLLKIQYVLLVIKYVVRTLSIEVSFFDADTLDDILVKYIQRCHHNLLVSLYIGLFQGFSTFYLMRV